MLSIKPELNRFDLSHEKKFDCDFGEIVPILCEEMVPGDRFNINVSTVMRTQPCVSPFLHEIDVHKSFFFVPYRLIDKSWEDFITGGRYGLDDVPYAKISDIVHIPTEPEITAKEVLHSLWDYFNFPIANVGAKVVPVQSPAFIPSAYPFLAYAIVYDEYFRDENLCQRMGGFNIPSGSDDAPYWADSDGRFYIKPVGYLNPKGSNGIKLFFNDIANQTSISGQYKYSSWKKDYFTSALPWQQRGTSPNVPLSFSEFSSYLAPSFSTNFSSQTVYNNNTAASSYILNSQYDFIPTASQNVRFILGSTSGFWTGSVLDKNTGTTYDNAKLVFNRVTAYNAGTKTITGNAIIYFSNQIVELGSVSVIFALDTITSSVSDVSDFRPDTNILASSSAEASFDINNIRLAYQIQLFLERNSRSGVRYTEFLKSHFSMFPRDERLQRPEFIGGSTSGLYVSEVLQTSQTSTTPQGNLAGKGIIADSGYIGSYQATEFGVLIGFQYIKPKGAYHQGLDRQWLRKTRYDYYFPEFAHLSEQAVLTSEIMLSGSDETNSKVFGFQGRYDEMRRKFDRVNGALRPDQNLEYWTLARNFSTPPSLNSAFVTLNSDEANGGFSKRVFAVTDERPFICNLGFNIQAMRPMPITSDPGYSDHPYMY